MRTPLLIAAACTGLVLLGGCGDDGSASAGDAEGSRTPSASSSASETDTPAPDDPAPSETPSEAPSADPTSSPAVDLPACAQVWVAGQDLPPRYAGCQEGGAEVPADSRECAFGRPLVVYGGRYYAVPGAVVNQTDGPVQRDGAYRDALRSCSG